MREVKTKTTKPLQQSHCNEAIPTVIANWLRCFIFSSSLLVYCKNSKNLVSIWQVFDISRKLIEEKLFFQSVTGHCSLSSHRSCKLVWFLDLEQHFPVQIVKTVITVLAKWSGNKRVSHIHCRLKFSNNTIHKK